MNPKTWLSEALVANNKLVDSDHKIYHEQI